MPLNTSALKRNLRSNSNVLDAITFVIAISGMVILLLTTGPLPEGYPEVEVYSIGWYVGFILLITAVTLYWTSHFYLEGEYTPGP